MTVSTSIESDDASEGLDRAGHSGIIRFFEDRGRREPRPLHIEDR